MRSYLLGLLLLLLAGLEVYAAPPSNLSIPDIFVWGQDRSDNLGVAKDIFNFIPDASRSDFLLKSESEFTRLEPRNFRDKLRPLVRIRADLSNQMESALSVYRQNEGRYADYVYFISGYREHLPGCAYEYSKLNLFSNFVFDKDSSFYELSLNAAADESLISRSVLGLKSAAQLDIIPLQLEPEFSLNIYDIDSYDINELNLKLDTELSAGSNMWIRPNLNMSWLTSDTNSRRVMCAGLDFSSMYFRDFSLTVSGAIYSNTVNSINLGLAVNGDYRDYRYRFGLSRSASYEALEMMMSRFRSFSLRRLYDDTEKTSCSFNVSRTLLRRLNLTLSYDIDIYDSELIFINNGNKINPYLSDTSNTMGRFKIRLGYGVLGMNYIARSVKNEVPYNYDEISLFIEKNILYGNIRSDLTYIGSYKTWGDPYGLIELKAEPFTVWNILYTLDIEETVDLTFGIENLLVSKIMYIDALSDEHSMRIHIGIDYRFSVE